MNWAALYAMAPYLAGLAVVWSAIVYLLTRLEPPVEPAEFGAKCQCGHPFSDHGSTPHGTGSPCRSVSPSSALPCDCAGFEPCERETIPLTPFQTRAQREHEARIARDLSHDRDSTPPAPRPNRLALVPECRCSQYAVEQDGGPLKCVACGEELYE